MVKSYVYYSMIKSYRMNRFAEVEGDASGWYVINMVTGIAQDTVYASFPEAHAAAEFVKIYYNAMERGY